MKRRRAIDGTDMNRWRYLQSLRTYPAGANIMKPRVNPVWNKMPRTVLPFVPTHSITGREILAKNDSFINGHDLRNLIHLHLKQKFF